MFGGRCPQTSTTRPGSRWLPSSAAWINNSGAIRLPDCQAAPPPKKHSLNVRCLFNPMNISPRDNKAADPRVLSRTIRRSIRERIIVIERNLYFLCEKQTIGNWIAFCITAIRKLNRQTVFHNNYAQHNQPISVFAVQLLLCNYLCSQRQVGKKRKGQ